MGRGASTPGQLSSQRRGSAHQLGSLTVFVETEIGEADKDWAPILKLLQRVPTLAEIPQLCDRALVQLAAAVTYWHNCGQTNESTRTISARFSRHALASQPSRATLRSNRRRDGLLVSLRRRTQTIHDRLQRHRLARRRLLLRSTRFGSTARASSASPKATCQQHWFRMGRALTKVDGGRALISWTGTMFEYLMPLLVMKNYPATLLSETYRTVVERQIEYGENAACRGASRKPLTTCAIFISTTSTDHSAFPVSGLKRGLIEDLVVAPTQRAGAECRSGCGDEQSAPPAKEGAFGPYGFYESIDYTAERLPEGQKSVLIRAFMTHHQGMSLVSLQHSPRRSRSQTFSFRSRRAGDRVALAGANPGRRARRPSARRRSLTGRVAQTLPGMITRVYESAISRRRARNYFQMAPTT